jgi:bifunctional UDP-N-acetylglucosamine pyrophosphorylase/glucosamine-1-phosphate N-acetyltransferase
MDVRKVTVNSSPVVVVLAAGEGTRMRSATPKVLHEVAGRSMLGHVLAATQPLEASRTLVVVGHGRDEVTAELASLDPAATAVVQEEQNGTGHAVRVALEAAPDADGTVLVLYGDMPLLTSASLEVLLGHHATRQARATLLTACVADPTGYGRVLRGEGDRVSAIVEEKDATAVQRAVNEINAGVYAFDAAALRDCLGRLSTDNAQGEEYLTDVIGMLVEAEQRVEAVVVSDPEEVSGVNDRAQLAQAGAAIRDRIVSAAALAGAMIVDPTSTWIDSTVTLSADCTIEPFTILRGTTTVGTGATVGPYSRLTDTQVGEGAQVLASICQGAQIGPAATVGPYSYLRPGTRLGRGAKAGGFVEMKNAELGDGAKVPHLSYVGDATIGERSNIGAGTIVVNYDGVAKHRTTVGDDARVGSNNSLVAPVTIGDTAYTAAGSVITTDVPPGSLGVGRARQRNIEGWVERKRGAAPADDPSGQDDGQGAGQ